MSDSLSQPLPPSASGREFFSGLAGAPGFAAGGIVSMAAKRLFDVAAALCLLAASLPLMLVAALCIKLEDGGPVLFRQARVGKFGRAFTIYKLRSMVVDAETRQGALERQNEMDGPVFKIGDDPRVTKVGYYLRLWNVDELPQLVNVLRGQMSMVGPRPMSLRDFSRFTADWALRRFAVKPGLTCLWQITPGRNALRFQEWMELDLRYIDTRSFFGDLLICLLTAPVCLSFRRPGKPRPAAIIPVKSAESCRECA
ncbi:MAG: sugar transferase [Desulfovibrionaceae bacterium]|nr:sugar transferase [Desulfovibrionaceae bacterium]MBF0514173.1 sugar transferase [Desulfovibrionaceae bacterium]